MLRLRVLLGLLWLLLLLATTSVVTLFEREEQARTNTFGEPRIDLYGNEIYDAVGDYRLDRGGTLYERHGPDRSVRRLRPPGT